jgi:hypothetical protein
MSQNDLDRGAKAEKLLKDEVLNECFDTVRNSILENIESWPIEDAAGAEKLRLMLKCLKSVRGHIEKIARNGKVAAEQLDYERKKQLSPAEWRDATGIRPYV